MFAPLSTSHIAFTMAANSLLLSFSQVETQKSKPFPPELPIHRRWISSSQYVGVGAQQVFEAYLPSENEGGWGKESFLPAILRTSLSTVFTYLGKQGDTCMNYWRTILELYLQWKREDICCGICPKPHFLHSPEGSPDLTRVAGIVYRT